jgi:hypothetical protein
MERAIPSGGRVSLRKVGDNTWFFVFGEIPGGIRYPALQNAFESVYNRNDTALSRAMQEA